MLRASRGYDCCIIMPDDVAIEKVQVLEKLGAKVERVRPGQLIPTAYKSKANDSYSQHRRRKTSEPNAAGLYLSINPLTSLLLSCSLLSVDFKP